MVCPVALKVSGTVTPWLFSLETMLIGEAASRIQPTGRVSESTTLLKSAPHICQVRR